MLAAFQMSDIVNTVDHHDGRCVFCSGTQWRAQRVAEKGTVFTAYAGEGDGIDQSVYPMTVGRRRQFGDLVEAWRGIDKVWIASAECDGLQQEFIDKAERGVTSRTVIGPDLKVEGDNRILPTKQPVICLTK